MMLLLATVMLPGNVPAQAADTLGNDTYFPFPEVSTRARGAGEEWRALDDRLGQIEAALGGPAAENEEQLLRWQKETAALNESITVYSNAMQSELQQLTNELETLGEPVAGESEVIAEQRKRVQQHKSQLEGKQVGYRLLLLRSNELNRKLGEIRQRILTENFFARGHSAITLLAANAELNGQWLTGSWQYFTRQSGLQLLTPWQRLLLGGSIVAASLLGLAVRRKSLRWCEQHQDETYRYAAVFFAALGRYAPHLLAGVMSAALAQAVFFAHPQPFVYYLGSTLPLLFLGWALLHSLFCGEGAVPAFFTLPAPIGRGLGRSLKLFVLVAYTGYLLFNTDARAQLSEAAHLLARDLLVLMMVLSLLWATLNLRRLMVEHGVRGVHGLLVLVLLGSLVAELAGYRNLAYWVIRAAIGTALSLFLAWLLAQLLRELFGSLRQGRLWWQQGLRRMLGYGADESMPWLGWIYLLAVTAVWLASAYAILLVWGVSNETLAGLSHYLLEGFQIGSLTVVPARIVVAILVFAVLLALSGWARGYLEERLLAKSRMERGSREALVTISGYVGVALAIVIALGVAGVQFTNLAIIAGALSVGIGFGLQNIVNNFVSGLILLFERPVKTGDWIMVGDTEGYVKRIRIRSTQIQTFDRADVIVPNSELISGQVTNWMLYDPRGRIKVPIGVAYGSDTQQVHDLLLKIAGEHPKVITDGSMTEPKVLFIGFGDSALNFELRAFVQNIDERLQIVSDINFAIDAAFREHAIEIPFPQRDLHLRNGLIPPSLSPRDD